MAAKNCKIILLQAAIKDLWTSANLKLKKSTLSKLISLGLYILYLIKTASQWVLQNHKRHENYLIRS